MKDSPLFLLLPPLLIVGIMGFVFTGPKEQEEPAAIEEQVSPKPEQDTSTSSPIAIVRFNNATTSKKTTESDSGNLLDIFKPKSEGESWTARNLLVSEPCDFEEIETFADELLAKSEWAEVLKQYPNRTYTKHTGEELYMAISARWFHGCYVKVELETNQLSLEQFNDYQKFLKTWDILPLINNHESYQGGSVEFLLEDIPIVGYDAGGPVGDSYGTYQYDSISESVRLFYVSDRAKRRLSPYEVDGTDEDMCPCSRKIELWITNPIFSSDIRRALEEKKLPEDWEAGE